MGNLTSPLFEWNKLPICELAIKKYEIWSFNGLVEGCEHILADLNLGNNAILRVFNDTRCEHIMHLQGH